MNTLAINGGSPYKKKSFPDWPMSDERELNLLKEVLESHKWWRMAGTKIDEFEKKFAEYHNTKYCLCLTNGTQAIEVVLSAMEIGKGDEVIVPAFTFISTATAPIYCNATTVPVDVNPDTFCMDVCAFEAAITPRTKAVIPVHLAGNICNMNEICRIAKKHNLRVIEDAAHAHGGEWNGKKAGSFGDAAIFSFQSGKIVTCGEGGAIITNNQEIYEKAYLIHGVGRPKNDTVYQHLLLGTNCRMTEFQAAVLLPQLERLESQTKKRCENAEILDSMLNTIDGIIPQKADEQTNINTHYMYMFYYNAEKFGNLSRNEFVKILKAEGIPAFIAYPAVNNTEFYKEHNFRKRIELSEEQKLGKLIYTTRIQNEVVWLPHFVLLGDEEDLGDIAGTIRKIQEVYQK